MRNLILKTWLGRSLSLICSVALLLFLSAACKSNKGGATAEVGSKVQMAELRKVIYAQVPDLTRATALINMVGTAELELGEINESYLKYSEKFSKATADHSKTAADLHALLEEWEGETVVRRRRLTDTLISMKSQTTAAEWPEISKAFINSVAVQSDRYRALHPSNS
ncbi:MAG: hypothetical protein L3J39_03695 [Verrucomicrobiales bacterium]|nr:hypothetical protein [Verrucomicrobiales bacterium]